MGVLRPDRLILSAVVTDDELPFKSELPVQLVVSDPREVVQIVFGVDVEAAVVGGALPLGGLVVE